MGRSQRHGLLTAVFSSVMNNMRTVLASSLSIDVSSAQGAVREAMIYANVIASDLGPMIMPIASLGDTALAAFAGNHHRISQDSAQPRPRCNNCWKAGTSLCKVVAAQDVAQVKLVVAIFIWLKIYPMMIQKKS
ncbi:hypothetical protein Pnap_4509 (plasmid) [Polaromonas naphthalenivorans CJ2]|uniref:Uncharacterized protein n=1 Tax=Polaromonas naphthalenivorans (strain CJ2) TaxID=365044 RepID=A1VVV4_POLNA|nr:hypothetical protein Pnap_4509 [Polaromonas naphthalenivorans CJ2]